MDDGRWLVAGGWWLVTMDDGRWMMLVAGGKGEAFARRSMGDDHQASECFAHSAIPESGWMSGECGCGMSQRGWGATELKYKEAAGSQVHQGTALFYLAQPQ